MNFTDFLQLLQKPNTELSSDQVVELEALIKEFPYFQPARALHLKALQKGNSSGYNTALKETAARTTDREVLYDFINSDEFIQNSIATTLNRQFNRLQAVEEEVVEGNYEEKIYKDENESMLEESAETAFAGIEMETDAISNVEMITGDIYEPLEEVDEEQFETPEEITSELEDLPIADEAEKVQEVEDHSESFQEEFMNSFHYETDELVEEEQVENEDLEEREEAKQELAEELSNVEDNLVIEPNFELPQTEESLESLDVGDPLIQSEYNLNFEPDPDEEEQLSDMTPEAEEIFEDNKVEETQFENAVSEDFQIDTKTESTTEEILEELTETEEVSAVEEARIQTTEPTKETDIITGKRSFSDWLKFTQDPSAEVSEESNLREVSVPIDSEKSKKFELLDKFIQNSPKIIPDADNEIVVNIEDASRIDRKELMTETLANLYVEQKKYKKAIKAFKSLSLKYPEKSSFFAAQIEKVKKTFKGKRIVNMGTFTIFLVLIIVVCLLLILVVMVQNPKGGGLSSSFGGGGNQVIGGVKKTGDFLDRSTWTLAGLLIVLILLSNISLKESYSQGDSKLLQGDIEEVLPEEPVEEATPALPTPGTETPAEGE